MTLPKPPPGADRFDTLLAWYFVLAWGAGYLASKTGLLFAAPFTFLSLRFLFGLLCLLPGLLAVRPRWPGSRTEFFHVAVAGLLMHAINLSGSHCSQYLGMSAGITALLLATQALFNAPFAHRFMGQALRAPQRAGVGLGLAGVYLVAWHRTDVRAISVSSLFALTPIVAVALEWALFGVVPTALSVAGIAVTCAGVVLVSRGC